MIGSVLVRGMLSGCSAILGSGQSLGSVVQFEISG